jgi:hypothetical protein
MEGAASALTLKNLSGFVRVDRSYGSQISANLANSRQVFTQCTCFLLNRAAIPVKGSRGSSKRRAGVG